MGRSIEEIRNDIENGGTSLGIEFGSTRIKAVLVDGTTTPVAQGSYEWENRLETGSGPIPWKISGKVCVSAIRIWRADSKKSSTEQALCILVLWDQRHDAWIYGI